jgi:uncharacterized protein YjdB
MKKTRKVICIIISLLLVFNILELPQLQVQAQAVVEDNLAAPVVDVNTPLACQPAGEWTDLFVRTSGWYGADGIYTIPLNGVDTLGSADSNSKTLFLFSDTLYGETNPETHKNESLGFINHSLAVLDGDQPIDAKMTYTLGDNSDFPRSNVFQYKAWLQDGIAIGDKLYIIAYPPGDDWKPNRLDLITVPLVNGVPDFKNFTKQEDIPIFYSNANRSYQILFGAGIFDNSVEAGAPDPDGYVYIYGLADNISKSMLAARVPRESFADFSQWRFWTGSEWSQNFSDLINNPDAFLADRISCEMSVTPITTGVYSGKYMLVYTRDVQSDALMYRIADTPIGPFSEGVQFYTCPDKQAYAGQPGIYTYNAKAHPSLSADGKLLVSYNVNGGPGDPLFGLALYSEYYRPRFVELDLNNFAEPAIERPEQENVALNKPATSSGSGDASNVTDGLWGNSEEDKWNCTDSGDKWVSVDLGKDYDITRWVVKHASVGGELPAYSTKDFKLQKSDDGITWTDVDTVTYNYNQVTDRDVPAFRARYVRLYITKPSQSTSDVARIYEFEVYRNVSTNVALEKPATSSGWGDASNVTDGLWSDWDNDKMINIDGGDKWVSVDLGQKYYINRWVVRHAGVAEDAANNTRDFKLQKSDDGSNWTDVDTVTGNTENVTNRRVPEFSARYVRLYITDAGADDIARIYEFEVHKSLPVNVALNKSVTANMGEAQASKVVDGKWSDMNNDKWCVVDPGDKWVAVDLGQNYNIRRWVVKHAAVAGESSDYNTSDFKLQKSNDGINWIDVDNVIGNTDAITDRTVGGFSARYVRLYITKATQSASEVIRIFEFEVYGTEAFNVALNKPATTNNWGDPSKVTDGKWSNWDDDKWSTFGGNNAWVCVDLGQTYNLDRWVVKHSNYALEGAEHNTKDFRLEKSLDGIDWTIVDIVTGNTADITDRTVQAFTARYVRLNITACDQNGGDIARIYEFEVYPSLEQETQVPVESIELDKNSMSMFPKAFERLTASVLPLDAANKDIVWSSGDTSVATVSNKGVVTAEGEGTTTIKAESLSTPSVYAECTVTVRKKLAPITLPVTGGLVLNLDASKINGLNNGDKVSTWNDLSGNGNNAVQVNADAQPTYQSTTNGAVRFDGNDRLTFGDIDAQTVFIVTTVDASSDDNDGIIGWADQDKGIRQSWDNNWKKEEFGSVFRVNRADTNQQTDGVMHQLTAVKSGGSLTLNALGEYYAGRGITADINEVIVFDRELTTAEICEVEYYLHYKWFKQKPVLEVGSNYSVNKGEKLEFTVNCSDADGDQVAISATGLPAGATFDAATGKFTWTPGNGQLGTYHVTFNASDGALSNSKEITIDVQDMNNDQQVTGVTLDRHEVTMSVSGSAITLNAVVSPENAADKTVIWTTSDETVATVNNGTVIAAATGSAIIVVTTLDGGFQDSCNVTVVDDSIIEAGMESVTASNGTVSIVLDKVPTNAPVLTDFELTLSINDSVPEDLIPTGYHWDVTTRTVTINFTSLGQVPYDQNVIVTAVYRSATLAADSFLVNKSVPSVVYVTSITVNSNLSEISINSSLQMNASVLPVDATNSSVLWSVVNGTGAATISEYGVLTPISAGNVTVKAAAKDGSGVFGTKVITIYSTPSNPGNNTPDPSTTPGNNATTPENNATSPSSLMDSIEDIEKLLSDPDKKDIFISVTEQTKNLLLDLKVLQAIKESGKDLSVTIVNQEGKTIYSWTIDAKQLASSDKKLKEVDFGLTRLALDDVEGLKVLHKDDYLGKGLVVHFDHKGLLPFQAGVKVYVGDLVETSKKTKIYLYRYNNETGKLETLPYSSKYVIDENGYININVLYGSDYVALLDRADADDITGLADQITVAPKLKTLSLSGKKKTTTINIELPPTLEIVKNLKDATSKSAIGGVTVTHSSSNKDVIKVDKNGKITAVGKGTAEIKTVVSLYSGKKKTVITKITVK